MQMELLAQILGAVSAGAGALKAGFSAYEFVKKWLRERAGAKAEEGSPAVATPLPLPPLSDAIPLPPDSPRLVPGAVNPRRVGILLHHLSRSRDADVEQVVADWKPPAGFTEAQRRDLVKVLKTLVRGARFHTTNGTKLSNYATAERVIDQILRKQPVRTEGEKVYGGWELKKFLGMGGFGEVWMMANPHFPDFHAVKFLTDDSARSSLKREAKALYAVRSKLHDCDNVIDYLNVDVDAQPHPFLEFEYAALGSLEDWILDPPHLRVRVNLSELIRGIVYGVSEAHKHGIHHRDLKPANILLTGGNNDAIPKIADFGLSTVASTAEMQSLNSSQAVLVGTTMYHPPEAANPFQPRDFAQDDVFALGVIWYQVLVGDLVRPPYDFAERLSLTGADLRSIKLISKCLAHPDRRYQNACELYQALTDVEPPPGPGEWDVPDGCFDVAGIAREYLERTHP